MMTLKFGLIALAAVGMTPLAAQGQTPANPASQVEAAGACRDHGCSGGSQCRRRQSQRDPPPAPMRRAPARCPGAARRPGIRSRRCRPPASACRWPHGPAGKLTPVCREASAFHKNWRLALCAAMSLLGSRAAVVDHDQISPQRASDPVADQPQHRGGSDLDACPRVVLVAIAVPFDPPDPPSVQPAACRSHGQGDRQPVVLEATSIPDNGGFEIVSTC